VPWGLTVDVEFGGCKCADEDAMEFGPDPDTFADNSWRCQCLDPDLYQSEPQNGALSDAAFEGNGKKCGIVADCKNAAVVSWTSLWNEEVSTADKARLSAKKYAKRSMMSDDKIRRAKTMRIAATKDNRRRAKAHMAGIAGKYKKLKSSMLSGSISKEMFEKGYKLAAMTIAKYKQEFSQRQASIDLSWDLTAERQQKGENYMTSDLLLVEDIFQKTLAVLNDRYGKKVAYIQGLPVIENVS